MPARLKPQAPEVLCAFSMATKKHNQKVMAIIITIMLLADNYPFMGTDEAGVNQKVFYPQTEESEQHKKKDWREDVQWGL